MSLTSLLAEKKASGVKNIPEEKLKIMQSSTNTLKNLSLGEKAVKKGGILPDFKLQNVNGQQVFFKRL